MRSRALQPLVRAARTLDRAIGRVGGRRTVLIEARTPMNLAVLRPVFEPLLQDRRLRVRFTGVERDDLREAFDELGVADLVIARSRASGRYTGGATAAVSRPAESSLATRGAARSKRPGRPRIMRDQP